MLPQPTRHRRLQAAAAVAILALSAACTDDHLARRETITLEAGNAKAVNMVQTAVSTMPASARHTTLTTDSGRMAVALERYRDPPLPEAEGAGQVESATPTE